ncbi:hypothetical protein OPV22_018392 [Ensete ventricosum]|uniref:Uncharacterized protein n=1 Tax=Ensete ventricosum TaxID=4639 RepID=A0AAV8R363_ENSVE|nr:hypothetical protein OPV22_018392 [Ensete ventricosum]
MRRRRAKEVRVFRGMDCPYSGIRGGGRNSHLASLDQMVEALSNEQTRLLAELAFFLDKYRSMVQHEPPIHSNFRSYSKL